MDNVIHLKDIAGWGADLDPKNRPAYPMWSPPAKGTGAHWERPEQQIINFKEFKSIERPHMSAVIGTSVAPSGLSGLIRQFAFRYSEGSFGHWIPLLMADRVNVVEGIVDDLLHGHIPNIYKEMGLRSELRYNTASAVRKMFVAAVVITGFRTWRRVKQQRRELNGG